MPTEMLSIGVSTPILAGVVYAIPNIPCILTSGAQAQTSILDSGPWTNVANGQINGRFLKCAVNTTVKINKYTLGK